jgi:uncharacterized protein YprB with RNaseH-like and TPR domain
MKADVGQITAIGIIKDDRKEVKFVDSPEKEKEALEWLKKELRGCDLIINWFGSGFDLPYILSRAVISGVELRELRDIPSLDLCRFCQNNLSLTRYSLAEVAKTLGILKDEKINSKDMSSLYISAVRGDKNAKDNIIKHCLDDLNALKKIFEKLEPYLNLTTKKP